MPFLTFFFRRIIFCAVNMLAPQPEMHENGGVRQRVSRRKCGFSEQSVGSEAKGFENGRYHGAGEAGRGKHTAGEDMILEWSRGV
jgi:hypothetical protein